MSPVRTGSEVADSLPNGLVVRVSLPPGWWELPVLADDVHAEVAALVDRRLRRSPEVADRRDELVELLSAAAMEAARVGAVFCAQIGIVGEDSSFSAGIVVAVRELEGLEGLQGLDRLAAGVEALPAPPGLVERHVSVVEVRLGALGDGVRRQAVRGAPASLDSFSVSYYFPLADAPYVVIINASSPNVAEASELLVLFDRIVAQMDVAAAPPDAGISPPA